MKLFVTLTLAALFTGCSTIHGLFNPNFERDEYQALLQRNNCPAAAYSSGVFEQACQLNVHDEALVEQWRRHAIPPDCKSQYDTITRAAANRPPHDAGLVLPPDPCWSREFERRRQWDAQRRASARLP